MFLRESIAANSPEGKFLFRLGQNRWPRPLLARGRPTRRVAGSGPDGEECAPDKSASAWPARRRSRPRGAWATLREGRGREPSRRSRTSAPSRGDDHRDESQERDTEREAGCTATDEPEENATY